MKFKSINTALLIALITTSCLPAVTVVPPTETVVPLPTFTSTPLAVSAIVTSVPDTAVPTSEQMVSLSPVGPWLVYRYNPLSPGFADVGPIPEEFVLLNPDGSGRLLITLPMCNDQVNSFLPEGENLNNYMAIIDKDIYIFRPLQATGLLIHRQLGYSYCNTYFQGNEKGGLLASFFQASKDVSPELILYELPGGNIRERFPLVRCSKDTDVCEQNRLNWPGMMHQQPRWSPNGRYLAFVAILDAASSDLFVYDRQNGNLQRLTNRPDWVGPIEWSPDGMRIIMQELVNDNEFLFDPDSKAPSSVWSVSLNTHEMKLLYRTSDAHSPQNTLFWLDDQRFIACEGFLVNADQASHLRFVDMETGTNRNLFDGDFVMESYDPIHETFAIYQLESEKYPQGIYLVSMTSGTIRYLDDLPDNLAFPDWDENTGLFVSSSGCENAPQSVQAFDYQGNVKCIPKPMPIPTPLQTASYPAPNEEWSLSIKDGLWLETASQTALLVSKETPSDVIWCPDSSCFFFSVLQPNHSWNLYHVSLPDLIVKWVDNGIESSGTYQWLGVEP